MSVLPVVAIVGRPNVGKSSLLNAFAQERVSIVEETPGVTRDRISHLIEYDDVMMEVVDTGGIGIVDQQELSEHIDRQIEFALRGANLVIFVTDVRDGVTELDRMVATRLRPRSEEIPLILAVNKVDDQHFESGVYEFSELGLGNPVPVSAARGVGRGILLEMAAQKLWPTGELEIDPVMKLAVVGRQNAGKSTFVNALAKEERVIVSEIPGTTRDSVDVRFEVDGREFVIIDTAGVQRKARVKNSIEFYSQARTQRAIRRADVVILMLDARDEISRVEKRLMQTITESYRVCVVVANKWDLCAESITTEDYNKYLLKILPALRHAPVVFTTAIQSRNVQSAVDVAQSLFKVASRRVSTGELNRIVDAIRQYQPPRASRGKTPKVYYATQVGVCPPTIVFFVNEPKLFDRPYRRYVEGALREALSLDEVPVRCLFRRRESKYAEES